jgi:endonuclease/exonuclease/phosphatase family metal-dependent hydrolase
MSNLRLYREAVAALGADIIGLQEVDECMVRSGRNRMTGEAANAIGGEGFFADARRRWDWGLYGNALLAKGRIRNTEVLRYERKSWRYERRVAVLASILIDEVTWSVANTHLSLRRDEQTEQLKAVAGALAKRKGPRVLFGDFNMAPDAVRSAIEPMGWKVLESDLTFPSWAPDHTIDYICVQEAVAEDVEVRSMQISDHAALLATLRPG